MRTNKIPTSEGIEVVCEEGAALSALGQGGWLTKASGRE